MITERPIDPIVDILKDWLSMADRGGIKTLLMLAEQADGQLLVGTVLPKTANLENMVYGLDLLKGHAEKLRMEKPA